MLPAREPPQPTRASIERAKAGSSPALDELVRRFLPEIRAFVRLNAGRTVRLKESCSDVVQTVCKDVPGKLHQFEYRGEQSFRGWLFVAVLRGDRRLPRPHARRDAHLAAPGDRPAGRRARRHAPGRRCIVIAVPRRDGRSAPPFGR